MTEICDMCGYQNPVWYAPNEVWNLVIGGPDAKGDPGGMLCPDCFIERAEEAGIKPTAWLLRPETLADYPSAKRAAAIEEAAKVAESFAICTCNGAAGACNVNDPPRAIAAKIRELAVGPQEAYGSFE